MLAVGGRRACPRPARPPRPRAPPRPRPTRPTRAPARRRGPAAAVAHVGQRDPAADRGDADDGPVVGPRGRTSRSPSPAGGARHPDLDEQLVRLQRGLEVARGRSRPRRSRARPAGPWTTTRAAEREQRPSAGRPPGRRAPASRRSCPGAGSAGRRPGRRRGPAAAPAAGRSSDAATSWCRVVAPIDELVAVDPDVGQLGDPADVDQHGGRWPAAASSSAAASARRPAAWPRRRAAASRSRASSTELGAPRSSNGAGITALTCDSAAAASTARDDVVVAGAAAEVALQPLADLRLGRVRVLRAAGRPPPSPCPACRSRTAGRAPARNAACTGCSSPSAPARPSAVVTSRPSACTASTVQDFTDSPSSSTVQAPQEVVSQPTLVARSPHTSRR